MKIPHSPRYCKSRFFAEREALANVTTREGTQGAMAPLQSGYFKYGMLNKLLSEGKKMRKFLTALVVVAILATSVLCVACQSFEGTAFEALSQMKEDGKIEMTYTGTPGTGVFLTTVTYDGFTMGDTGYICLYINSTKDENLYIDGFMASGTYKGETFNPSVAIDKIVYEKGMKLLVVYTEPNSEGQYVPAKGEALLFTLPNKVEKVTLD